MIRRFKDEIKPIGEEERSAFRAQAGHISARTGFNPDPAGRFGVHSLGGPDDKPQSGDARSGQQAKYRALGVDQRDVAK